MNPPIDRPDGALRAWLEMGPDRGRPEALERALAATRRVPQRPAWTYPERWLPVNRALIAAAAALIVVVGAAAFVLRPASQFGPPPSSTPTSTQAPAATPTTQPTRDPSLVPEALLRNWVGAPHDFPSRTNVKFLTMGFQFGQIHVNANFVYGQPSFDSEASVVGANTLELKAVANGCGVGQVGHYRWSLSPRGTLLQLTALDEACPDRSVALAGSWHAANCKDETGLCWGDLEPGTYPTLFYAPRLDPSAEPEPLYGGVTFTVPDGWAVGGDHTTDFRILRSSDYAKEGPSGPGGQPTQIEAWIRPVANSPGAGCGATRNAAEVNHTASALANWIHALPGLTAGSIGDVTIDGHTARWIDIGVADGWKQICDGKPTVELITEDVGPTEPVDGERYLVSIAGQTRMRLIFVDIGKTDLGTNMTAMIVITAPDQATFDAFVDEAMPIVQSFRFK